MTYPINSQTQQIPGYSGITINIANPNISSGPQHHLCPPSNYQCSGGPNCMVTNPIYQQPVYPSNVGQNYLPHPKDSYIGGQTNPSDLSTQQNLQPKSVIAEDVAQVSPQNSGYGLVETNAYRLEQFIVI